MTAMVMTRTVLAVGDTYEYRGAVGDARWNPLSPEVTAVAKRLVLDPFWIPTPADLALLRRPRQTYFLVPIGGRHG